MLVLKRAQRAVLADKLPDLANLAVTALVFAQILGDQFSVGAAFLGVGLWLALISWAIVLS